MDFLWKSILQGHYFFLAEQYCDISPVRSLCPSSSNFILCNAGDSQTWGQWSSNWNQWSWGWGQVDPKLGTISPNIDASGYGASTPAFTPAEVVATPARSYNQVWQWRYLQVFIYMWLLYQAENVYSPKKQTRAAKLDYICHGEQLFMVLLRNKNWTASNRKKYKFIRRGKVHSL